jgi:predicted ATPase
MGAFGALRFLDLSPDAMRLPSIPGETHLSDRGENLSSVLHGLCENPKSKAALASWIERLTPMDVVDFEFPADAAGKILLHLVEQDGRKTSAYSASDGTLRFLGMLAAMLGPDSGKTFVFEELDNGIHPARLDLLMALLRKRTKEADLQVIATTHSPQLVRLLGDSLADASITYREEGASCTGIRRLSEIEGIGEALKTGDLAELHESSWFEDAISFAQNRETGK